MTCDMCEEKLESGDTVTCDACVREAIRVAKLDSPADRLEQAAVAACREYDHLHRDKTTIDGARLADAMEALAKLLGLRRDRAACTTCVEVRGPTYDRVWAAHHGPL